MGEEGDPTDHEPKATGEKNGVGAPAINVEIDLKSVRDMVGGVAT